MATTFVDFRSGTREFVVQAIYGEGQADVGIVFTSGGQSWATRVLPSHKSRVSALDDTQFLAAVVNALVTQDESKYEFEVCGTGCCGDGGGAVAPARPP